MVRSGLNNLERTRVGDETFEGMRKTNLLERQSKKRLGADAHLR